MTDAGVFFAPRDAILEGPSPERGGGAGLALIRAWSQVVAYARRGGRNRLELEMPLPEAFRAVDNAYPRH